MIGEGGSAVQQHDVRASAFRKAARRQKEKLKRSNSISSTKHPDTIGRTHGNEKSILKNKPKKREREQQ